MLGMRCSWMPPCTGVVAKLAAKLRFHVACGVSSASVTPLCTGEAKPTAACRLHLDCGVRSWLRPSGLGQACAQLLLPLGTGLQLRGVPAVRTTEGDMNSAFAGPPPEQLFGALVLVLLVLLQLVFVMAVWLRLLFPTTLLLLLILFLCIEASPAQT